MPKGSKPKDLFGKRFGKLVALRIAGRSKCGNIIWECRCDCGNTSYPWEGSLSRGRAKCCGKAGCVNIKEDAAFRRVLHEYLKGAEVRGYSFSLTEDEFRSLTKGFCFYCGTAPSRVKRVATGQTYLFNGVDRVHPLVGYESGNCVSCCWACNRMKGNLGQILFFKTVKRIYDHHRLGEK